VINALKDLPKGPTATLMQDLIAKRDVVTLNNLEGPIISMRLFVISVAWIRLIVHAGEDLGEAMPLFRPICPKEIDLWVIRDLLFLLLSKISRIAFKGFLRAQWEPQWSLLRWRTGQLYLFLLSLFHATFFYLLQSSWWGLKTYKVSYSCVNSFKEG
jgi:hypothetical protein